MAPYLIWFSIAVALAGLEMLTGTFYLLVFALAAGAGGIAALLGLPLGGQLAIAASGAIVGILWLRRRPVVQHAADQNNLDIGQRVEVVHWLSPTRARVRYRGAEWEGELANPVDPQTPLFINGLRGNTLLLAATPRPAG